MQHTPFRRLVAELASHFAVGDTILSQDLPQLSDDDLSVALNNGNDLLTDGMDPSTYADLFNASHTTFAERTVALGEALRADVLRVTREYLANEVNDALVAWEGDAEVERFNAQSDVHA